MYYESVMSLIDKLTKMLTDVTKKFKQTKFESTEMTLRKTVDATGISGRNLADVFGIYDYPTLFRTVQSYARQRKWEYFEIGDYIIAPNININGANYANIRFILTGINSYDGIGNSGSYIPGLVFSAYNVLYNDTWLNVCNNDNIINNAGQYINNSIGQNLNSAWHYNSQRRQAFWKSNSAFILSEQELSNPMRSYTIGNTHSNQILPLYKRSSLSKYRYNLSNQISPFWLSNKDQYNSLYLEAVYRTGWQEYTSNKHRYHWETVYDIVGTGPYNTPIYGNPHQEQVRDSFSLNHYNKHLYTVKESGDNKNYGPLQYKHSATDIDTLHYCFILEDIHYTTSGYVIPTHNPWMFSVSDSHFTTSTSSPLSILINLLNGDRGNTKGNFIYYQWIWGQVFDHYNYHYEMGALYQQINKLPINSLYNASSGVTFSIYA